MKTRVISASVLIVLVVACFAISPVTRILFMLAATVMAIWETCRAVETQDIRCCPWVLYLYAAGAAAAIYFKADDMVSDALFFAAIFVVMTVGIVSESIRGRGALATLGVLCYPVVPFIIVMRLALLGNNMWVPVFAIGCISTWVCDSFALFGGKRFGKHKVAPYVSPNKTVEGCISGAVSSVVVGVILYFALKSAFNIPLLCCMVTALVCSTFGQVGDLAASLIKRMAGIKDYSNLIPGHGGVVDRTDSLLFSIPCAYFCLAIAGIL